MLQPVIDNRFGSFAHVFALAPVLKHRGLYYPTAAYLTFLR
jgi:hypothetical protein